MKILPPDLANDAMRLERFTREARAAAALNHPNILSVHDVAAEGDVHYLVSELLEGQTLAERLQGGAGTLAVRRAVDLAQQIAQGLAAAHARGIVHRDLKPANVFITTDGRAKILDFGLAKQSAAADAGVTTTGAGASPDTDPGQVLGTVGYMAPEQVRGQAVDARADIFAFGALLYEMLAGRRAFAGDTAADTLSAILGKDPPDLLSYSDHLIPPALQRIVARCLEKDAAARFQSAADLAFALQALTSESTASGMGAAAEPPAPARRAWREWLLGAAALAGVSLAGLSWVRERPARPALAPIVAQFSVDLGRLLRRVTLSPGGGHAVVYLEDKLLVYALADGSLTPVGPTSGRNAVAWAPDGSAFATLSMTGQLVVYRLRERSIVPLATLEDLAFPVSMAWSRADEVVVADGAGRLLIANARTPAASARVLRAAGGPRRAVAGFLSNTHEFLSVNDTGPPESIGLFKSSTDGRTDSRLDGAPWDSAVLVDDTTLLAKRGSSIYELRLNERADAVVGEPRLLLSTASVAPTSWSVSTTGVLAMVEAVPQQFSWFTRAGQRAPLATPAMWNSFDMTPDGRQIVTTRLSEESYLQQSLWKLDGVRGAEDRLTFGDARSSDPSISSGGETVAYVSGSGINSTTRTFTVQAGQPAIAAFEDAAGVALDDWSADGRWFVYHHRNLPGAVRGLLARSMDGSASRVVARCEGTADSARIAPTGRWLAYNCNESGRHEVYVQSFPEPGPRVRVSLDGGMQPTWNGDASELYYLSATGTMMVAELRTTNGVEVTKTTPLFETAFSPSPQNDQYRVTADGQRFLVLRPVDNAAQPLRVIINWRERFKAELAREP